MNAGKSSAYNDDTGSLDDQGEKSTYSDDDEYVSDQKSSVAVSQQRFQIRQSKASLIHKSMSEAKFKQKRSEQQM